MPSTNPEQSITRPARPESALRWQVWTAVFVVAVNLIVALAPRFFPYGDTPNHLARYTLISASWSGAAPEWVHFRWLPTGYIAIDVITAALVGLTSPATAMRALVAAYVILLPLGAYALLRAVNPRSVGWSLVACLLTFNWYFLAGFLSYSIGIALALLWLAWWWPRRKRHATGIRLLGAIGIAGLYLVHMAAAATALVAVGVACTEPLISHRREHKLVARRVIRRFTSAATYAAPAIALNLIMKWSSAFPQVHEEIAFRSASDKLLHLAAPFVSFSRIDGIVVVVVYAVALALCWSARKPHLRVSVWPLTNAALIACYFVCPVLLFAAWDVDVRFLLPAALLAFVATASDAPRPPSRLAVGLLASAAILHAVDIRWNTKRIDISVTQFLTALRQIPPSSTTLVLVADEGGSFRIDPFLHIGEWLTIQNSSDRVNGLFSGKTNGAYLGHFVVCPPLYDPGVEWLQEGFPALDWDRIRHDYDYIALAGTNNTAQARVRAGADPIDVSAATTIYRVDHATPEGRARIPSLGSGDALRHDNGCNRPYATVDSPS